VQTTILNKAQRADGADGKWRALDGRPLWRERLGFAAHAGLAEAQALARLGLPPVKREDGNGFEVGGVDAGTMAAYSSRAAQIEEQLARLLIEYQQVYGRAPDRVALYKLRKRVTLETRKAKQKPVGRGDVLVVDEASQVSTQDLARICSLALQAGARVIGVGDTRQLPAVEAGGLFSLIARRHGHWKLTEVRRFGQAWERAASVRIAGPVPPPGAGHLVKPGTKRSAAAGTRDSRDADVIQLRDSLVITVAFRGSLSLLQLGRELGQQRRPHLRPVRALRSRRRSLGRRREQPPPASVPRSRTPIASQFGDLERFDDTATDLQGVQLGGKFPRLPRRGCAESGAIVIDWPWCARLAEGGQYLIWARARSRSGVVLGNPQNSR
jgi:hypothetical protein